MSEHQVADRVFGQQTPQADGEWLVVIVLADEDGAPGAIALRDDREVVVGVKERRFLDQHVLAGGKRLLRQVEMESRRDGDDDGVDAAIRKRLVIAAEGCPRRRTGAGILPPSRDRGSRSSGRSCRDSARFRCRLCTRVMNPHPRKATCNGSGSAAQAFFLAVPPI